jgi:hypothetical protein
MSLAFTGLAAELARRAWHFGLLTGLEAERARDSLHTVLP